MSSAKRNWVVPLLGLLLSGSADGDGEVSCSVSAVPVVFDSYSPLDGSGLDSTGRVTVRCDAIDGSAGRSVAYVIRLGPGSSGSVGRRAMSAGGSQLVYALYVDATRTTIWGDGSDGSSTVSDAYPLSTPSISRDYVVYGHLPARQNVRAGAYADLVMVTVEY